MVQTKHVIFVFGTFSLSAATIVNKPLHHTFSLPNTLSTVILVEDKFLLKFISHAERLGLSMYDFRSYFYGRFTSSPSNIWPIWCPFAFTPGSSNISLFFSLWYSAVCLSTLLIMDAPREISSDINDFQIVYRDNLRTDGNSIFSKNNYVSFCRKLELSWDRVCHQLRQQLDGFCISFLFLNIPIATNILFLSLGNLM